jgi:hypothetical protein
MSSVLTIGGTAVNRYTSRIILNRLTLSLDRPDELEFSELATNLPGSFAPEQAITLTIDGTLSFSGWIFSRSPAGQGRGPISVGYRCLGLRYAAYLIAVTAADGTGTMAFNLPVTDALYASTEAGLSVGTILTQVFAQHKPQFTAAGIATDPTTTAQLAPLTVVPPEPVYFVGNNLWANVDQFLQQWYGSRYASYISPAGLIRIYDTTLTSGAGSLTPVILTLPGEGAATNDPVVLEQLQEDTSECYTRVVLRGRDEVEGASLSLSQKTLAQGWTPAQQSQWSLGQYLYPTGAYSQGTLSSVSSTAVTCVPLSATEAHPVNYWSGIQAQISLIDPLATDVTGFEYRVITASDAYAAGASFNVTLDRPLVNSSYTAYQIRGTAGTLSDVWRKYTIPNHYVAQHLTETFNFAVQWSTSQDRVAMSNTPIAVICFSEGGLAVQFPLNFEVVLYDGTNDGYIRFYEPVVDVFNGQSALIAGGASVVAPTDVMALVPYSRGTLRTVYPADSGTTPVYGGTAYTEFGIGRTYYRDYPGWADRSTVTMGNMNTLAHQIFLTYCNVTVEGSLTYFGKYQAALPSGSWPIAVSIAKDVGTTGYESINAPVRTVVLEYPQGTAVSWLTRLQFSTKRQPYSGDRLYVHPNYAAGTGWFQEQRMGGAPLGLPAGAGMMPGIDEFGTGVGTGLGPGADTGPGPGVGTGPSPFAGIGAAGLGVGTGLGPGVGIETGPEAAPALVPITTESLRPLRPPPPLKGFLDR